MPPGAPRPSGARVRYPAARERSRSSRPRAPGGGFGARQVLSASRRNDQLQAVLAVNPAGRAVAAWTNSPITGATPLLAGLRTSRTRRFDRAAAVTARGLSRGVPAGAIDGRGRSIALWEDAVGSSGSRGILGSAHR